MRRYLALLLALSLSLPLLVIQTAALAPAKNKGKGEVAFNAFAANADADFSQDFNEAQAQGGPLVSRAVGFAESAAVSSFPPGMPEPGHDASMKFEREGREVENEGEIRRALPGHEPSTDDALQPVSSAFAPQAAPPPAPSLTFDGLNNRQNLSLFPYQVFPPDANGDVGPNHYVQAVNSMFIIFDKEGHPLTTPAKLSSLFEPLGWPCGDRDDGDPIVLYDQMADRWMLSQFCIQKGPDFEPPFHQLIAVSQTGDPAGAYYLYDFVMPGGRFNDYPKFGVWPDGYYMTDNQFYPSNGFVNFDGTGVFAFDRRKMLTGDPSASFVYFNLNIASHPEAIAGMLPADADGMTPPPVGSPCPFAYFTADEYGDAGDGLRVFDFHADFAAPQRSTFRERPESAATPGRGIPVAAFNPLSPPGEDDVPQPPPSTYGANLDAISDRLMCRLQYRNFGGHESLVVNHTVDVNPNNGFRAGIRYYELRKQPGNNPYKVNEQATFAGSSATEGAHRWMGSAAMNAAGDLAVAYSVSSPQIYPSLRYAARFGSDAPGGLRQGEQTIFNGSYSQRHTRSRWGDYSSLSVDPSDDCSFWFTGEAYEATAQYHSNIDWVTKISRFSLRQCAALPRGSLQGKVVNAATGLPIPNALVATSNGYMRTTGANGNYSMSPVVPDSYSMTVSAPGYAKATASGVTVMDGGTVIQNFMLTPVNRITPVAATITSETIPDGVLDPGETVTVNLSLKNTGGEGARTTNLRGTLRATGGVLSPSGTQTFGTVISGGPPVSMPFTFKVDPNFRCGSNLIASLGLTEPAETIPPISYTFLTGMVEISYTGAPVWIPDRSSVNIPLAVRGFKGRILDLDFKIGGTSCTTEFAASTVGIDQASPSDITVKLRSPKGTVVTLFDRVGGDIPNFCQTRLDDDALLRPSIEDALYYEAPFVGRYRPNSPLSAFDGQDPNGTWILSVTDHEHWWNGHVRAFSLIITPHECTQAPQSISGQVTVGTGGAGLPGVTMTLTSPGAPAFTPRVAQTDSTGHYSFANLPAGRNYQLSSVKTNYNFTPSSRTYTYLDTNQKNQNFAAALKTYAISGQVTKTATTAGIGTVTMTISSPTPAGFAPKSAQTASTGNYTFSNLPAGRDYTIKPMKNGFTFTPATRSIMNLSDNMPAGPSTSFSGTGP
jgi:hypothetical protein